MTLLVHIVAGGLGLLSGYVALAATKGASLHRRSGMLFVCVMVTMSVTGMLISAFEGVAPAINVPSAALTFYLVTTSLVTVRPAGTASRPLAVAAMLMAVALGLACMALGLAALTSGKSGAGMAYPLFLFAAVGLLAAAGDFRALRAGGLRGRRRLARHLWRMCFALFIASIAFFLGGGRVPAAIRTPALLATGVLLPVAAMAYWLWRLRVRASVSRIVPAAAS
jgi:uncharacterized membrane protein